MRDLVAPLQTRAVPTNLYGPDSVVLDFGAAIVFAEIMAGHYWLNLSAWLVALLCLQCR